MRCSETLLQCSMDRMQSQMRRLLPGSPWTQAGWEVSGCMSHACLVTVEGRDVEHVAVCAHANRLHLPIAGQWC
jgi:hypothetical protein